MCKNIDTAAELRPFVFVESGPVLSPASQSAVHPSPLSESPSLDEDDDTAIVSNRSNELNRNGMVFYALLTIFVTVGFFFAGTAIGTRVDFQLQYTQYSDDSVVGETVSDSLLDVSSNPTGNLRKSADTTNNNGDQRQQTNSKDESLLISYLSKSTFAQNRVAQLMADEYTSSSSPESDLADRLENAIEALKFLEEDGEPVPIEGHDFMFVGSVGASLNEEALRRNNITHIIDWSSTTRCNTFEGIEYLCIRGIRSHATMVKRVSDLEKAVEFIESARSSGGKAMSHCWYGRNRSVTLLVAYLMKYDGMTSDKALKLIQKTRPQADPYQDVLDAYEKKYLAVNKK